MTKKKQPILNYFLQNLPLEEKVQVIREAFHDTLDSATSYGMISILYKDDKGALRLHVGFPYCLHDDNTLEIADEAREVHTPLPEDSHSFRVSIEKILSYKRRETLDLVYYK
ncbi:MAG: hypothetical protein AABW41_02205 [Nanoarchaeota archaeon]